MYTIIDKEIGRKRVIYLDYLRVFATFAVIILHVAAQNWHNVDVSSFEWQVFNFYDSVFTWCVAVFVMISGTLFLSRDISIKTLYTKYILRIVIAFVFWSLIYAILAGGNFSSIMGAFIKGHYHLWFLFMIIGIYICVPMSKAVVTAEHSCYFLIIGVIFSFFLPGINLLVDDFGQGILLQLNNVIYDDVKNLNIYFVLGYSFYFILGYFINNISLTKKYRIIIYSLGIVGGMSTVCFSLFVSLKYGVASQNYYSDFWIGILLEALAIFVLFKQMCNNGNNTLNSLICKLSKYSFGSYLVHALIIEGMNKVMKLNSLSFYPVLSVPCIAILVFVMSFGISAILNKVPFINKYIV